MSGNINITVYNSKAAQEAAERAELAATKAEKIEILNLKKEIPAPDGLLLPNLDPLGNPVVDGMFMEVNEGNYINVDSSPLPVVKDKGRLYFNHGKWEVALEWDLPLVDVSPLTKKARLLAIGIKEPEIKSGFINTDGVLTANGLISTGFYYVDNNVDDIHLVGQRKWGSPVAYITFFSSTTPSTASKISHKVGTGEGPVALDEWLAVPSNTKLIAISYDNALVLDITEVKQKSLVTEELKMANASTNTKLIDARARMLINGLFEPKTEAGQYINTAGDKMANGAINLKYHYINGGISRIRLSGHKKWGAPISYISLFSDETVGAASKLFTKSGVGGSGTVVVDEWITVLPGTRMVVISHDKTLDISITDVQLTGSDNDALPTVKYSSSNIGNVDYQEIDPGANVVNILIGQGQSTMDGNEPSIGVTLDVVPGDYMFGDSPQVVTNGTISAIRPLASVAGKGESPIVTALHSFASIYRRFVNREAVFAANSVALGGRSIEALSKECTNTGQFFGGKNIYHARFLNTITQMKNVLDAQGKVGKVFAIAVMQGEHNYIQGGDQGLTTGSAQTNEKDTYKSLFVQLKNNMQTDIMNIFGQDKKPLIFLYQTSRSWIWPLGRQIPITRAQQELADEHEDIIMMAPTYNVPDYTPTSAHLSSNGARSYGEIIAKTMYKIMVRGDESPVVMHKNVSIVEGNKVKIDYKVPVEPLVLDGLSIPLKENYGFLVYVNGSFNPITKVEVVNGNSVLITCANDFSDGQSVEVTYASGGGTQAGTGNLRDSDGFGAKFTFGNYSAQETTAEARSTMDAQGNIIYGKKYPLQNWASPMYVQFIV